MNTTRLLLGRRILLSLDWYTIFFGALLVSMTLPGAFGQSDDFSGHPTRDEYRVFAGWNTRAGRQIYDDTHHPESLPNLRGWDYRVNLPSTQFLRAALGPGSGAAMVGVVEETQTPLTADCSESNAGSDTLKCNSHVNNAIWLFRVAWTGRMYFKILPSRRQPGSSTVTNVENLSSGWQEVGSAGGPLFVVEKPAVVAVGEGLGNTTIHVAARGQNNLLYVTSLRIASANTLEWGTPWTQVDVTRGPPSLAVAFGERVALAWTTPTFQIRAALLDSASGSFGPTVLVTSDAEQPQLVAQGGVLHLLSQGLSDARYYHSLANSPSSFGFTARQVVGSIGGNKLCDAIGNGGRLHVACSAFQGGKTRIWYSTSLNASASTWSPQQFVGLEDHYSPQLGALGSTLWIAAVRWDGKVTYVRKDSSVTPYEYSPSGAARDHWLEVDTWLDPYQVGIFDSLEMLSFNHDLYLTATRTDGGGSTPGLRIINFSRAALKRFVTGHLSIELRLGSAELAPMLEKVADPIEGAVGTLLSGDVNGDGASDLVLVSGGTVRVALWNGDDYNASTVWCRALPAGTYGLGDVDGDGVEDLISATSSGGRTSITVARSSRSSFSPLVTTRAAQPFPVNSFLFGDVNGDRRTDAVALESTDAGGRIATALGTAQDIGGVTVGRIGVFNLWGSDGLRPGWSAHLADSDGDGDADLFLLSRKPDATSYFWTYRLASNGSAFGSRTTYGRNFGASGEAIHSIDIDNDSRVDLVAIAPGNASKPGRVTALLGGDYTFVTGTPILIHSGVNPQGASTLVGRHTQVTLSPGVSTRFPTLIFRGWLGGVFHAAAANNFPLIPGAPWERYRFFTEKVHGVTMFPQWIVDGGCVHSSHRFHLRGSKGVGSLDNTWLSVRPGSAEGHVLEELGHSLMRSCFSSGADPFGLFVEIFSRQIEGGGFEANTMGGACDGAGGRLSGTPQFIDCRDPEHYFIGWMKMYRLKGDLLRNLVATEPNATRRAHYAAQYQWLKRNWFGGVEFYHDQTRKEARRETLGLTCLPSLCP